MRVDMKRVAFFIFFLSLGLALWAGQGKPQKKETAKDEKKSLIRKELLLKTKRRLDPPRRNIFSIRMGGSGETRIVPVNPQPNPQETSRIAGEESSELPLDIRYIGHIKSGEKIVALIIFEGSALAVEKGEMINERAQIGDVTSAFIEIIGSDSVKRKYPLEGEKE